MSATVTICPDCRRRVYNPEAHVATCSGAVQSDKLCECGCGQPAPIASYSNAKRGWTIGQPKRFIAGHFSRCPATGTAADYAVDDNGCWLWLHGLDPNGYGRMSLDRRHVMAHRWVWERERGPLQAGVHLHHRCRTPRCVNPAHLQPLTQSQHSRLHALERNHAPLPVRDIAIIMANGGAFVDADAVRVAAAFLDLHDKQTT
jgi:hypothetical protein